MKDYYRILNLNRNNFSKEKLEKNYNGFIQLWKLEYEKHKDDNEKISELEKIKERYDRAYTVLSSDKDREEYNELLDKKQEEKEDKKSEDKQKEDKKRKAYDCINMYDQSLITRVSHRRCSRNIIFEPYKFEDEGNSRQIICKLLGFISYSTEVRDVGYELARYEVEEISIKNPEIRKYKVITPIINYNEVCDNPNYRDAVYTKLFSEENLIASERGNYGYLGRIVENNGEFVLDYNQKEFCAAAKFSTSGLKNRVDNPKKPKSGIKQKFKGTIRKIARKILEKTKQDDGHER